ENSCPRAPACLEVSKANRLARAAAERPADCLRNLQACGSPGAGVFFAKGKQPADSGFDAEESRAKRGDHRADGGTGRKTAGERACVVRLAGRCGARSERPGAADGPSNRKRWRGG